MLSSVLEYASLQSHKKREKIIDAAEMFHTSSKPRYPGVSFPFH
jgi:hypothetical protein